MVELLPVAKLRRVLAVLRREHENGYECIVEAERIHVCWGVETDWCVVS
jgi:hypothetical protein